MHALKRHLLSTSLLAFYEQVFETLEPNTGFLGNYHLEHLAYKLTKLVVGDTQRLIVCQPPRSGKSTLSSVALPMFLLGRDPTLQIMALSHTHDLARKFHYDRGRILNARWFQEAFPNTIASIERDTELQTTMGGCCFASGMVGGVTGRGADFIIIDDPLKGADSLSKVKREEVNNVYDTQVSSRLNQKKEGRILIVAQRLHEDDLPGHVMSRDEWEVVTLPAIAPEDATFQLSDDPRDLYDRSADEPLHAAREPMEVLESQRRSQGSLVFEAQYQQCPVPASGNVIHREWIRYFDEEPAGFNRIITSWDTASTLSEAADFSVCTVWGTKGADFYLLEVHRGRWETPELRHKILELDHTVEPDANLIEDTELGRAIRQEIARTEGFRMIAVRPKFDKEARLLAQAPRFECGQVHVPRNAPWLGEYLEELLGFPNCRHDDQVDSTSQALYWLTARNAMSPPPRQPGGDEPEDPRPPPRPVVRRDIRRKDFVRRDIRRRDPVRR